MADNFNEHLQAVAAARRRVEQARSARAESEREVNEAMEAAHAAESEFGSFLDAAIDKINDPRTDATPAPA